MRKDRLRQPGFLGGRLEDPSEPVSVPGEEFAWSTRPVKWSGWQP